MAKGYVIKAKSIFRQDLRDHPKDFFVFGDNMNRRGMGGLAKEMRDEPNALGVPTKWAPFRTPSAYFRDHDWANQTVATAIVEPFEMLRNQLAIGRNVIFPFAGLGTGRAQLDVTAPLIFQQLGVQLKDLIDFSGKPAIVARTVPLAYMNIASLTEEPKNGPTLRSPGTPRRGVVILGG